MSGRGREGDLEGGLGGGYEGGIWRTKATEDTPIEGIYSLSSEQVTGKGK